MHRARAARHHEGVAQKRPRLCAWMRKWPLAEHVLADSHCFSGAYCVRARAAVYQPGVRCCPCTRPNDGVSGPLDARHAHLFRQRPIQRQPVAPVCPACTARRKPLGDSHHFLRAAKEPVPYAIERYIKETRRLYGVLDVRLKDREYLADEYSIADIATYPWVARFEWHKTDLSVFPNVKRWFDAISNRPAVQKGMKVPF